MWLGHVGHKRGVSPDKGEAGAGTSLRLDRYVIAIQHLPHATQCVLIGYPTDYKGWRFWDPQMHKAVVSDSTVFCESVFPFQKPGLSGIDTSVDPIPPVNAATPDPPGPPAILFPAILADPLDPPAPLPAPAVQPNPAPAPVPAPIPAPVPAPAADPLDDGQPDLTPQLPACALHDLPERPRTPPAVKQLTSHFEHHPSLGLPLPPKRVSRARLPGALAKANSARFSHNFTIPLVDAVECALNTSVSIEPKTLADVLKRPDADRWVAAALAEIEAHLQNGTWELVQLPPGRRAIGSRWV